MQTGYRRDIQGLRALAVLLVALNHAAVGPFGGGFVGVDVFFVVSGYLITSLLLAEAERDAGVSLLGFYARRARRILPMAGLVVVVTVAATVALASAVQAQATVKDAVWSTFFAANIRFASDGTDYFALDSLPSPLQHYWSLAVEEQFYVVWPLLVLLLCWVARRVRARRPDARPLRPLALTALVVIVGASLTWSVISTLTASSAGSSTTAYFSPFTRGWELGLGALAACLAPRIARAPGRVLGALAALGLGMVLVAALGYDATTAFPGYAATLPVAGAALLLLGGLRQEPAEPLVARSAPPVLGPALAPALGVLAWLGIGGAVTAVLLHTHGHLPADGLVAALAGCAVALALGGAAPTRWSPLRLLRTSPARIVGDWSFSFYLWHWPVLILARDVGPTPSGWYGAALLVGALALSGLSYTLVENPARRAGFLTARRLRGVLLYPALVAVTLPLLVAANRVVVSEATTHGAPISTLAFPTHRFAKDPVVALVQASTLAARHDDPIPGGLRPALLQLPYDVPSVGACDYFADTVDRPLCPRGDTRATRNLVLIGDSHARQWIPALEVLAKRYGYTAYYLVREGCPAAEVTPWMENSSGAGPASDCTDFQDWAVQETARLHPAVTILAGHANPNGFTSAAGKQVRSRAGVVGLLRTGIAAEIQRLRPTAGRVIVIGDPPPMNRDPGYCLTQRGATLSGCSTDLATAGTLLHEQIAFIAALRDGTADAHAEYVDTTDWFCAYSICPAIVGTYVTRRDYGHISTPYAAYLSDELERQLKLAFG